MKERRPPTPLDLADLADELCDPHRHIERIWDRDPHRNKRLRRVYETTQPGLLTQLAEAITESTAAPDSGSHNIPGSRPPGAWEAMATHSAITIAAAKWCWELGIEQRDTVESNLRALVGHAPRLDQDKLAALVHAARTWRHQAAVLTGWAAPTFNPQVACPIVDCARTNTLRINLDRHLALCGACEARWSDDDQDGSFNVLAAYVESATDHPPTERPRIRSGRAGNGGWIGPATPAAHG